MMKTPTDYQISQLMSLYKPDNYPTVSSSSVTIMSNSDIQTRQKKDLSVAIHGLKTRLKKLDAYIEHRENEEAPAHGTVEARKERAAKEFRSPSTVAELAHIARENKKFAAMSKQEDTTAPKHSLSDLKMLATKTRGQIAVAQQKLDAL